MAATTTTPAAPTSEDALGGRIPLIAPAELTDSQRKAYDYMEQTMIPWANKSGFQADASGGRLIGPFNPLLLSPEMGQESLKYLDAEREHTMLSPRMREIVILTVGAAFSSEYELYAHKAVAKSIGLEQPVIDALAAGQTPIGLEPNEMAVYEMTQALATRHKADATLYRKVADAIGADGIVGLVHLAGIYMTISTLLNVFEVPAPGE